MKFYKLSCSEKGNRGQWRIKDFPDGGGASTPDFWVQNLSFGKILAENCMKRNEKVPRGGVGP